MNEKQDCFMCGGTACVDLFTSWKVRKGFNTVAVYRSKCEHCRHVEHLGGDEVDVELTWKGEFNILFRRVFHANSAGVEVS